ncbi:hypothetical protein NQ315_006809 [Exocentrus adspersus]|uniref:Ig-like domain-containing protein n=1 Tax=Exocentrus adspersus TaxID=1586481 RepID=A0AAV8WBM9_9CUCU|nr:hypothetical protein NQ315_006809 [Exocentrus adspersus]
MRQVLKLYYAGFFLSYVIVISCPKHGFSLWEDLDIFKSNRWEIQGVRALRDMHIKVPEAVRVGQSVTLACDYDLESVALYSIKWYRYDEEFYRYVPKEAPPSIVFPMPHLKIDWEKGFIATVTVS